MGFAWRKRAANRLFLRDPRRPWNLAPPFWGGLPAPLPFRVLLSPQTPGRTGVPLSGFTSLANRSRLGCDCRLRLPAASRRLFDAVTPSLPSAAFTCNDRSRCPPSAAAMGLPWSRTRADGAVGAWPLSVSVCGEPGGLSAAVPRGVSRLLLAEFMRSEERLVPSSSWYRDPSFQRAGKIGRASGRERS